MPDRHTRDELRYWRHVRLTRFGDRLDAVREWAITFVALIGVAVVAGAIGTVVMLTVIELSARWLP